jgi:hypothetical protein
VLRVNALRLKPVPVGVHGVEVREVVHPRIGGGLIIPRQVFMAFGFFSGT